LLLYIRWVTKMKPGSNSVEVHPQLSHKWHPVDDALVGAGYGEKSHRSHGSTFCCNQPALAQICSPITKVATSKRKRQFWHWSMWTFGLPFSSIHNNSNAFLGPGLTGTWTLSHWILLLEVLPYYNQFHVRWIDFFFGESVQIF
jgi:hypothetical protein